MLGPLGRTFLTFLLFSLCTGFAIAILKKSTSRIVNKTFNAIKKYLLRATATLKA
jgi:Na+/H+-dicarboxylate symporter